MSATVRIGTRSSELALFQARQVAALLAEYGVASELVTYTTIGDRILDKPLAAIGEKGLFTAELEADLLAGRTDCAVHSLKDLPTADPAGLIVVALLEREDPRDAFVTRPGITATRLAELPDGAKVGTSSLRRRAQLRALRPDLEVCELRGNVGTRLRKIDEGQVDAAPRAHDEAMLAILRQLDHAPTRRSVTAERALLATLEGGCQVPIGAATLDEPEYGLMLHGLVASVDGSSVVRGGLPIDVNDPAASGRELARQLHAAGGAGILEALRAAPPHPARAARVESQPEISQ